MKKTLELAAAPTGMQSGGYVGSAYANRSQPFTRSASIDARRGNGSGWRIELAWDCPEPVRDVSSQTDQFTDAAALLVPSVADAPWITMGAPGKAVEGALWRADRSDLLQIRAEGLGTVKRMAPPEPWKVTPQWENGRWRVVFDVAPWPSLEEHGQISLAIWRGAARDRGGLKSISPAWLDLES
jgi:DMSO reductase family type II enzyme heme b subunit